MIPGGLQTVTGEDYYKSSEVTGWVYVPDEFTKQAHADFLSAYQDATSRTPTTTPNPYPAVLDNLVITRGVYVPTSSSKCASLT